MKQITIAEVSLKPGSNAKGPWLNAYITDTEGTKWSVFDDEVETAMVEGLVVGDVIDANPKMKDGLPLMHGGRIKMASFTIVTKGAGKPATTSNGGDDPAKRLSIERQSSLAAILGYIATLRGALLTPLPEELAFKDKAIAWGSSRYDDIQMTELAVAAPTPGELERALSQTEKDWNALESAGSGLDVAWAVQAAEKFGWKVTTLHSWLKSQGLAPTEGETMVEIFGNIHKDKVELIRSAIETRLTAKGG